MTRPLNLSACQVYPDYRERCARHEAAHFLIGYLLGVPIAGYSLDVGRVHTDFAEKSASVQQVRYNANPYNTIKCIDCDGMAFVHHQAKLQCRLVERKLTDEEVDVLAVVSMAGVAAEGLKYEEVRYYCEQALCIRHVSSVRL
eukprot:scaffold155719_cov22-Prasinocladus_malaysianus.AAC.1